MQKHLNRNWLNGCIPVFSWGLCGFRSRSDQRWYAVWSMKGLRIFTPSRRCLAISLHILELSWLSNFLDITCLNIISLYSIAGSKPSAHILRSSSIPRFFPTRYMIYTSPSRSFSEVFEIPSFWGYNKAGPEKWWLAYYSDICLPMNAHWVSTISYWVMGWFVPEARFAACWCLALTVFRDSSRLVTPLYQDRVCLSVARYRVKERVGLPDLLVRCNTAAILSIYIRDKRPVNMHTNIEKKFVWKNEIPFLSRTSSNLSELFFFSLNPMLWANIGPFVRRRAIFSLVAILHLKVKQMVNIK